MTRRRVIVVVTGDGGPVEPRGWVRTSASEATARAVFADDFVGPGAESSIAACEGGPISLAKYRTRCVHTTEIDPRSEWKC
jgi:hypothetical protein